MVMAAPAFSLPVWPPITVPATPPGTAPAPPGSSRTSTVQIDSTVPHRAQFPAGAGPRAASAGCASSCASGSSRVIAPTPIKLRIITEAATPAIIGLIRIDAGLKVLAFMIRLGVPRLAPDLGSRVQTLCQGESFQSTQRLILKSRKSAELDMSPADDGFRHLPR